ncbi:MAG: type I methionyl aminopeptidase [Desulfomonile tiedjei]|uniref:Methionine aminopeptidase n=1 Tax=Desulfomonile tiedjei TaxID=2358 RepID=A0A9D6Z8P6_9BACT|nr:type I methionyl aminopeptidase [Desulfomonile tiedjei]
MIILKTHKEIEIMREANRIVAEILQKIGETIQPGTTTGELDKIADRMIEQAKARSAFKGYRMRNQKPYPASICSSVNEEVVHGIPGSRVLKEGDIVGIDVGVVYKGFVGDAAKTFAVGKISDEASNLLHVTEESLYKGISQAVEGKRLMDISGAIQNHVETHGFSVVRDFVGHGVGRKMHEPPQIPNYRSPGWNPRLQAGMALALEPMVNEGTWRIKLLDDEWTAVTADGKLSAHFEHSIAITDNGPLILSEV